MLEHETLIIPHNEAKFRTNIQLKLIDKDGNVLREIEDSNAETIWSKVNTPSPNTLYLDFVVKEFNEFFGLPLGKINKTCFAKTNDIRSNILNTAFSYDSGNKRYSVDFNWTNSTVDLVTIYGLMSISGSYIYTLFDLSVEPIVVDAGSILIGSYRVEYDNATPSVSNDSISASNVTSNTVIDDIQDPVSSEIRDYKFTRIFIKTSVYFGVDTGDTEFSSALSVTAYSNASDNKALWSNSTFAGELFYKCLTSGQPGGAVVVRYLRDVWFTLSGVWTITQSNIQYGYVWSNNTGWYTDNTPSRRQYFGTTVSMTKEDIDIRPYRINFPNTINKGLVSTRKSAVDALLYDDEMCSLFTPYWPNDSQAQFMAYLYWPNDPVFKVYLNSMRTNVNCVAYISGTQYTATKTTGSDSWSYEFDFDLTGLSAGNGIIILVITPGNYIISTRSNSYEHQSPKLYIAGDMYGYAAPYTGMLTEGSGGISENWISSGFMNVSGIDTNTVPVVTDATIAATIDTVQNTEISDIMPQLEYQYWAWVKLDKANTIVGTVSYRNEGRFFYTTNYVYASYYWSWTTNTNMLPYYVNDANMIAFGSSIYNQSRERKRVFNGSYYEYAYTQLHNNHILIDVANRELSYLSDNVLAPDSRSTNIYYVTRQQGSTDYTTIMPSNIADYTEGIATSLHDGITYEFETTLASPENIRDLTVTFTAGSTFALAEYISIAVNDADNVIVCDALENWRYYKHTNIPLSVLDPIVESVNLGSDDIFSNDYSIDYSNLMHEGPLSEVEIREPDIDMKIGDHDFTHYMTFTCNYADENNVHLLMKIPKSFKSGTDTYYVNVESLYITDGMHVIAHEHKTGHHDIHDEWDAIPYYYNYEIRVSKSVLLDLFPEWRITSIVLYVYFVAKKKDDILPITVQLRPEMLSRRIDNNGIKTTLLYSSDNIDGDVNFVNTATSSFGELNKTGNIIHSEAQSRFNRSSIFFDGINSRFTKYLSQNAESFIVEAAFTFDVWIRPLALNETKFIFAFVLSSTYDYIYIDILTSGVVRVISNQTGMNLTSVDRVSINNWHHVAFGCNDEGIYYLWIDGKLQKVQSNVGSYQRSAYSIESYDGYLRIGSHPWADSNYFVGYMDEIHYVTGELLWTDNFEPPQGPWGSSIIDHQYNYTIYDKQNIIKLMLPYSLDDKINVIDKRTGTDLDFAQTSVMNWPFNEGLSNRLYVRCPKFLIPTDNIISFSYMDIPYSAATATNQSFCNIPGFGTTMNYFGQSRAINSYPDLNGVARYDEYMISELLHVPMTDDRVRNKGYNFNQISTVYYTKDSDIFIEIQDSATSHTSDLHTFFDVYMIGAELIDNRAGDSGWNDSYVYRKSDKIIEFKHCNMNLWHNLTEIPIAGNNFVAELNIYRGLITLCSDGNYDNVLRFNQCGYGYLHRFKGVIIEHSPNLSNNGFKEYNIILNNYPAWNAVFDHQATQDRKLYGAYYSQSRLDYRFYLSEDVIMSSIVAYDAAINVRHDYEYIDTDGDVYIYTNNGNRYDNRVYYKIYANHIDTHALSTTPTKYLYSHHKSLKYGETPTYQIDNFDLVNSQFSIKTFTVDTLVGEFTHYNNTVGSFILSDINEELQYELILEDKLIDKDGARSFAFTKNVELATLLATKQFLLGVKVGYVDSALSVNEYLSASTTYSNTITDTVVIANHIIGWRQAGISPSTNDPTKFVGYTHPSFKSKDPLDLRLEDIHFVYCNSESDTGYRYRHWRNRHSNRQFLIHHMTPLFNSTHIENIYMNYMAKSWVFDPDVSDDCINNTGVTFLKLVDGAQTLETGQLGDKTVYVNSRIIVKSNTNYNMLFDINKIAVDNINSFGLCSYNIYTDEYDSSLLSILPMIKVIDTNTFEERLFTIDNTYYNIVDVTDLMPTLTLDTLHKKLLDNYAVGLCDYSYFNELLSNYTGDYELTIGIFVYCSELNRLISFDNISIQMDFSDPAEYTNVDWCYFNEDAELLSNNLNDIRSIPTSYELKLYNPSASTITDTVTKLKVSDYDFSTYNNGIVAYDSTPASIPTLYVTDKYGSVSADISDFNDEYIYVKLPSISSDTIESLLFNDIVNPYSIDDIFNFYDNLTPYSSGKWNLSYTPITYTVLGQDIDNGIGNTSTSDRIFNICHVEPLSADITGTSVHYENCMLMTSVDTALNENLMYELSYRADEDSNLQLLFTNNYGSLYTDKLVPYWHEPSIDSTLTFLKANIIKGHNHIYVYYNSGTSNDASDANAVFKLFDDFAGTAVNTSKWKIGYSSDSRISVNSSEITFTNYRTYISSFDKISGPYTGALLRHKIPTKGNNYENDIFRLDGGRVHRRLYMSDRNIHYHVVHWNGRRTTGDTPNDYKVIQHEYRGIGLSSIDWYRAGNTVKHVKYALMQEPNYSFKFDESPYDAIYIRLHGGYNHTGTNISSIYDYAAFYPVSKADLQIEYGDVEIGSWSIDGHTFINRKKIDIKTTHSNPLPITFSVDISDLSDSNVRFVSSTIQDVFVEHDDVAGIYLTGKNRAIVGQEYNIVDVPYCHAPNANFTRVKLNLHKGINELWYYYNSATADDISSVSEIYELYDDFSGAEIDKNKWHIRYDAGNVYQLNDYLYITHNHSAIRSHKEFVENISVETYFTNHGGYNVPTLSSFFNNNDNFYSADNTYLNNYSNRYNKTILHGRNGVTGYSHGSAPYTNGYNTTGYYSTTLRTNLKRYKELFKELDSIRIDHVSGTYAYAPLIVSGVGDNRLRNTVYTNSGTGAIHLGSYLKDLGSRTLDVYWHWLFAMKIPQAHVSYHYDAVESGTWTIDGHVFNSRCRIVLESDIWEKEGRYTLGINPMYIDSGDTFDKNIRIQHNQRDFDVIDYVDVSKGITTLRYCPAVGYYEFSNDRTDITGITIKGTSSVTYSQTGGALVFHGTTGGDLAGYTLYYIRGSKLTYTQLTQLYYDKVSLLIQNKNSDWYLFDTAFTSVPNKSNIETLFNTNAELNKHGVFYKAYRKFPENVDANKFNRITGGRYLNYKR